VWDFLKHWKLVTYSIHLPLASCVLRSMGMRLFPKLILSAIAVATLLPSVSLRAVTIAEHIGGAFEQTSTDFRGQSFTTPEGAFNNIAFNFFSDAPATTPWAQGNAFLFSMPFSEGPTDMSSMSPGFLGEATAADGFWTFDPSMTLLGDTQYYFYMCGVSNFITSGPGYGGGSFYIVSGGFASQPWNQNTGQSCNFRVTGSPVPETGMTLWLLALGVFGLFGWRRLALIRGW
jgi:hypothetical protein